MNRTIFAACGAIAIAGLTVSAQSTSTPSTSQTTPASQAGRTMTVTGCLVPYSAGAMGSGATTPGTTGTTGTTGATGATGSAGAAGSQFMLTKIESGAPSATGTTGTTGATGTTGSTASAGAHSTLMLKPGSSVMLSEYVNQKVELTGTMDAGAGSMTSSGATTPGTTAGTTATGTTGTTGAGTTGTTGATATTGATGSMGAMPSFNVTNVKVVAKTCS